MAAVKMLVALLLAVCVSWAAAHRNHVVGGDHGWAKPSEVRQWLSDKVFKVGDKIWFIYSAALEGVAELRSQDDFETCDVSNPIRLYSDGIDSVPLEGEGTRYFTSINPESCKDGLKLRLNVLPNLPIESTATSETVKTTTQAKVSTSTSTSPSAAPTSAPVPGCFLWAFCSSTSAHERRRSIM